MKLRRFFSLAVLLLALPVAANAVPVKYDITFSANAGDADGGTGSFFWDSSTRLISLIRFDFGGGNSGGINDAAVNWSQGVFGGTLAEFFFETVTSQDVHPVGCSTSTVGCSQTFSAASGLFGYPGQRMTFGEAFAPNSQFYQLQVANGTLYNGTFTTRLAPVRVPEPAMLTLLSIGLFGLGFIGRRRRKD